MRSSRLKAKNKISKWDKAPSGSEARSRGRPNPYKFAAEMDFLDSLPTPVTTDNLPPSPQEQEIEESSTRPASRVSILHNEALLTPLS